MGLIYKALLPSISTFETPPQSVTAWRKALDPDVWTRLTVRDEEKGPN
jgi:hypothetical protein